MKHLFIPYELAVIAKERGFKEPTFGFFNIDNNNEFRIHYPRYYSGYNIGAPLYQEIVDWFRMKHGIVIYADPLNVISHKGKILGIKGEWEAKHYNEYYEALNEAIEEAFKLISS